MAEGALFDVAEGIMGIAGKLAAKEIALISGVKDEITKLWETVSTIKAVILDAEAKQHGSEVIKEWLKELKDAMCDADDLLDEISTEALGREVMTRNKKAKEVRIFFSKSNQLAYGVRMGHKVKAMRERFDAIAADRKFHLDGRSEEEQVRYKARRETHSFVLAAYVIGREEDKKAIIGSLLDPDVEENVSVLSIVGIGGLGKTTVAQLVFNDEEVKNHFELKLWVCVSDDFDVKIIVEKILECVYYEKPKDPEMNTLVNDLKKGINGKRYLLVLDDVWNEDREKWLILRDILNGGARGSRILLTTRIRKVAEITKSMQSHLLRGLDDQQSWSLLKKMAFKEGEEQKSASFENIGKEILKKCGGVPLAIRTIGGLLYFKKTEKEWLSFKNNELWNISKEHYILSTLKLSYDYLPSHLKQCFAFCSIFPKDYEIEKASLIYMWMAQGFIKLYNKKKCPEDVGDEYFMDLLWRSFFQEVEEDEFGNISKFKIHDLMHDLAIQVTGSESTTIYSKEEDIDEETRHVSFGHILCSSSEIPISLYKAGRIRTFFLPCQPKYDIIRSDNLIYSAIVESFKFMRLLDLHNMGIKTIPSSIKKLKHLRYLDLSMNEDIEMLPNSIVKLYNLQTLKLSRCYKLKELPRDINKLVNLKFLGIDGCFALTHMPNGLGQLTNLQTLSRFVISKGRIDSVPRSNGGLKELERLNELRGNLSIENLKQVKDAALKYKDANLKEKQHLDRLDLNWVEEDVDETVVSYDDMSLEALQPHVNLKALSLDRYGGVIFPHWFLSLTNLVQFNLISCKKCQYLPPLDQFPSLKIIYLDTLDSLEHISDSERDNSDSLFYPSLQKLYIWECPNLKGWWRGRRDSLPSFPRLSNLDIGNCPLLTSFPLFPYLEESLGLKNVSSKPLQQTMSMSFLDPSTSSSLSPSSPLPKLNKMALESIEDIEFLPAEWAPYSLKELQIWNCPKLTSMSGAVRNLTSLCSLSIGDCEEFDPLRDIYDDGMEWRCLNCLRDLCFKGIPKLKSLPVGLQCISTLNYLTISNCPNLMTLPVLTSLCSLSIDNCFEFDPLRDMHDDGMEWRWPNCLHDLCFRGIPKLKFLPMGPQCVSTLKRLTISNCPNLITLPKLTSLEYLDIERCDPNLTSLETLRCLTSLRWLWLGIEDFPNLITFPDSIRISNLT